jgi:hypothetical protein
LNGNPHPSNTTFDGYLINLSEELTSNGHTITDFKLREMDISFKSSSVFTKLTLEPVGEVADAINCI